MTPGTDIDQLVARIVALEARVAQLESSPAPRPRSTPAGAALDGPPPEWTTTYEVAQLESPDSWIEIHEQSARPHLQKLLRQVVEVEGPVTESLAMRRVREAWGLRRAGARVQATFEQAIRQLAFTGRIERSKDGTLSMPGQLLAAVRVPGDDEATRRSAEEVPRRELDVALLRIAADAGGLDEQELTMRVSRLFGWTRRGAGIQSALDARVAALVEAGELRRQGARLIPLS